VVNPEQAEIVRLIFQLFLEGMTPHSIAAELTNRGIQDACGQGCVEPTDGAPDALKREV
jgi:site-specific DNA recombinase